MQPDESDDRELDRIFLEIFEGDRRGQRIYEALLKRFGMVQLVHTTGGIDAVLRTYRAAAHREVLSHINARCARARGAPMDDPDPQAPEYTT